MNSVLLTDQYKKALDLVAVLFKDQRRKVSDVPYMVHLVGVSHIVAEATKDADVAVAALLHDVLEDVSETVYSAEHMTADFGERITSIVQTVSHDEEKYGRIESRRKYLEQIKHGPLEACIVSAADLLFNAMDILALHTALPDEVARDFGGDAATRRQWFWAERFKILKERLGADHTIIRELVPALDKMELVNQEIS